MNTQSENRRQLCLIVAFAVAMVVVAVASAFVADAEPGTTKIAAGVLAVLAFILAVLGILPLTNVPSELVNVARRALRAIAKSGLLTTVTCIACIVGGALVWHLGPSSVISEPVACSGATQVHYRNWAATSDDPTCKDLAQVTLTSWQPRGRKRLVGDMRCIYAKAEPQPPKDLGVGQGFQCPPAPEPPPPPPASPPIAPPATSSPVARAPAAPVLKQAVISHDGVLDVTFLNPTDLPVAFTRVRGVVVGTLGASPMPILKPLGKFPLVFTDAKVGTTAETDLHVSVDKAALERFQIQVRIRTAATIKFDFFYDADRSVSVTKTISL